ncbi:hypothetical protein BH11BAC2_BH11BAC2_03940 [soil metagenome]
MIFYKSFHHLKSGLLLSLLLSIVTQAGIAQDHETFIIKGKVYDSQDRYAPLQNLMVVNMRTQQGVFGFDGTTFEINALHTDSIVIIATGYSITKICFRDSLPKNIYNIEIPLRKISIALKGTTIMQKRSPQTIENEIKKLGYNPDDYKLHGVDAWQSPITAIYQEFSRRERSKRKVAELENNDRRKALLREMLYQYSLSKLIEMEPDEYDNFIQYMNLNDVMLQSFSQYDLALYIRERYYNYNDLRRR